MSIALFLAAAAAQPDAAKLELARQIARHGMLAQIAPVQMRGEVDSMIADHPELTPAEQARLRAIGQARADEVLKQAIEAEALALAQQLDTADLESLATFAASPAAEHQRAALPEVIGEVMKAMGRLDYDGSVRQAFCAESGKLCDRR